MRPLTQIVVLLGMMGLLLAIFIPNYLRARSVRSLNQCVDFNLPDLAQAKQKWALAHGKKAGDTPADKELLPYLENHKWPVCHIGGKYSVGPVSTHPVCSRTNEHPWN